MRVETRLDLVVVDSHLLSLGRLSALFELLSHQVVGWLGVKCGSWRQAGRKPSAPRSGGVLMIDSVLLIILVIIRMSTIKDKGYLSKRGKPQAIGSDY